MLSTYSVERITNKSIVTKLHIKEYNRIMELVHEGLFLNVDDFVMEAIRDKLSEYSEPLVSLREIPYEQMREEIIKYVKSNPNVDAVDIADDLLLDPFKVNDIIVELMKEGIFGEVR